MNTNSPNIDIITNTRAHKHSHRVDYLTNASFFRGDHDYIFWTCIYQAPADMKNLTRKASRCQGYDSNSRILVVFFSFLPFTSFSSSPTSYSYRDRFEGFIHIGGFNVFFFYPLGPGYTRNRRWCFLIVSCYLRELLRSLIRK